MRGATFYADRESRTRYVLHHNRGSFSGLLYNLSPAEARSAIRGTTGETSRLRATYRRNALLAADEGYQLT